MLEDKVEELDDLVKSNDKLKKIHLEYNEKI